MQIFLKIFSRLRIFYLAVCGKIIWLFVGISIGDLRFYGNPIRQRSYFITSRYKKNTAYALLWTGVWHNPRIIKQKQYIPKYALTLANLIRNDYKLPDLLFLRIDSSVKICMVRVRERLSADNRLQRYNKNLKYTK